MRVTLFFAASLYFVIFLSKSYNSIFRLNGQKSGKWPLNLNLLKKHKKIK
jgi:hypothetical protein